MPFTPSHIAAVLPIRRWLPTLPLAALAFGSMSPDAVYFVPGLTDLGGWTHQPWAVVSLDVVIGSALWALWRVVARPLHRLSPQIVRERWRPSDGRPTPLWIAALAVALGAATHLFWDSFTHAGRWATTHWALLSNTYPGPLGGDWAGYRYAQYLSGALGLAIIVWVAWREPRVPATPIAPSLPSRLLVPVVVLAGVLGAALRVNSSLAGDQGVHSFVFDAITGGIGAAVLAVLILVAWQARIPARTA